MSDYLNYSKDGSDIDYKQMPTLVELHAGAMPGFDFASSGVGSVVSQFRRVHNNILIANYNALSGVTLDDAASRMLVYSNLLAYGALGVGESCHNSQWVFGVGNMYVPSPSHKYRDRVCKNIEMTGIYHTILKLPQLDPDIYLTE